MRLLLVFATSIRVVEELPQGALLLFDLGWLNYTHFDQLTHRGVWLLTRAATNTAYSVEQVLSAKSGTVVPVSDQRA